MSIFFDIEKVMHLVGMIFQKRQKLRNTDIKMIRVILKLLNLKNGEVRHIRKIDQLCIFQ